MTLKRTLDRLGNLAQLTIATMLGVILAIAIFALVSSSPGHPDIVEHQDRIIMNQRSVICLLLVAPEDRDSATIAACQIDPESLIGNP